MNTAFDDFRRIAQVTVMQRDPRSGKAVTWLARVLALALAIGAAVAAARGRLDLSVLARAAVGMAGFWLVMAWGMLFIPGSVLIHSAVNARLLPRQRRRLMQMAVTGWLLCTLATAVALDSWAAVPLAGFYLIGFPLMLAGYKQALAPIIVACNVPVLSRHLLPRPLVEALASAPSLLALSALLLPAGVLALRLLYPAGGDAWIARRDEQVKRIQRFARNQGSSLAADSGGATGSRILRLYGTMLRRDCRRREPGALLMHALGPAAHWSAWIGAAVALPVGVICLRLLMVWNASGSLNDALSVAANVSLATLASIVVFCTAQFGQQLRRTRGEQALLRLTPLAGDARLLNRRLASQLLKGGLRNWAMMAGCIVAATLLVGGDGVVLLRQCALCCLAGQVAMMGLLGDYAVDAGWNLMLALRAALLAALEAGVAFGLGWLTGVSAWPWLIVIAVGGAVFQVRLDWRRMLVAPVAFPAGRLA